MVKIKNSGPAKSRTIAGNTISLFPGINEVELNPIFKDYIKDHKDLSIVTGKESPAPVKEIVEPVRESKNSEDSYLKKKHGKSSKKSYSDNSD